MKYEGIRVRGFMTMAPAGLSDKEYHKYFNKTYRIFIDFSAKKSDNIREPVLSMGMSGSFIAAIGGRLDCCPYRDGSIWQTPMRYLKYNTGQNIREDKYDQKIVGRGWHMKK